mmetsp:Transcript_3513/g.6480  ORF Transcript_3513/g.6480 Transcript_3513/m.6480 type:complete len:250 (+) Transcript_3513:494-1243(+)
MEAAFATLITSQIPSLARINLEPSGAVSKANSGSPLRADAAMLSPRLRVTMVETFVTSLYNAKGPFCPVVAETRFATSVRRVPGRPASASFSCSATTRAFSRGRSRRWSSVSARALLPPGSTTAARESPTHPHAMLHSAPPFTLETSTTVAVLPTRWPAYASCTSSRTFENALSIIREVCRLNCGEPSSPRRAVIAFMPSSVSRDAPFSSNADRSTIPLHWAAIDPSMFADATSATAEDNPWPSYNPNP